MVEISDFNRLFGYTVDNIYGMMLKYKQDHEEKFKEMVLYERLVQLWNDCGDEIDDYIMDVCESPANAWCVFTHYEHDPVRLLYGYSDAIEPNTGCLEDFLDCEDEDDVEEIFNDYRYSDNGEESLNAAADDAMTYTDDMWAIIINYATPSDILNGELEGLEIYDSFANDVFDEAKSMAISNFEKIKQMAQENEE